MCALHTLDEITLKIIHGCLKLDKRIYSICSQLCNNKPSFFRHLRGILRDIMVVISWQKGQFSIDFWLEIEAGFRLDQTLHTYIWLQRLVVNARALSHTDLFWVYIYLLSYVGIYVRRWVSDYPSPFKGLISTDLWTRCASRLSFEFDRLTSIGKFIVVVFVEKKAVIWKGKKPCFFPLNGVFF